MCMLTRLFSRNSVRKRKSTLLPSKAKKWIGVISACLLLIFIAIKLAWSQPYKPADILDSSIHFNQLQIGDDSVHYAYSGDTQKQGIIFIHGTPGRWAAFEAYLSNNELQQNFFMVSVDRPGWGKSKTNNRKSNGVFSHQATNISEIFKQYPQKKWIVVGHSLGASLAPKIALKSPDSVNGLLLLAGSLNPKLGNPRWYNYAAKTWLVSKMIGAQMTQSNREIMKLRSQLTLMDKEIKKSLLTTNIIVIQGTKDKLVSPNNSYYASQQWQDNFGSINVIEIKDAGHFIPWQHRTNVINAIQLLAN